MWPRRNSFYRNVRYAPVPRRKSIEPQSQTAIYTTSRQPRTSNIVNPALCRLTFFLPPNLNHGVSSRAIYALSRESAAHPIECRCGASSQPVEDPPTTSQEKPKPEASPSAAAPKTEPAPAAKTDAPKTEPAAEAAPAAPADPGSDMKAQIQATSQNVPQKRRLRPWQLQQRQLQKSGDLTLQLGSRATC